MHIRRWAGWLVAHGGTASLRDRPVPHGRSAGSPVPHSQTAGPMQYFGPAPLSRATKSVPYSRHACRVYFCITLRSMYITTKISKLMYIFNFFFYTSLPRFSLPVTFTRDRVWKILTKFKIFKRKNQEYSSSFLMVDGKEILWKN